MPRSHRKKLPAGVEAYHRKGCRTHGGGTCNCMPSYRAKVTGPDGKRYTSPRFRELAAARNWQTDTLARMNSGTFIAPTTVTMRMAAEEFIEGAKGGAVLTRKGVPYRPSAIRD